MNPDVLTGFIFLATLTACAGAYVGVKFVTAQRGLAARIQRAQGKAPRKNAAADLGQIRRAAPTSSRAPVLDALMRKLPNVKTLQNRLEKTGRTISVGTYALANVGIMLAAVAGFLLFTKMPPTVAMLLGLTLGLAIPHWVTGRMVKKRFKKFLILFPEALELIVRGLRSGLPVAESIHVVAHEIPNPVGGIFEEIGHAIKLGVPLEKALGDTAARLQLTEFNFFVTSIGLQRETGGNLAEILANLAETLRNRVMMRLKIKAYASEARASAAIVGSVPIFIVLALMKFSPDYLMTFVDTFKGNIAMGVGMFMFGVGVFIMNKLANFEI